MKELLKCVLCPRMCSADRLAGELGHCRGGAQVKVFRWGPHHGEEPPLSGVNGSGAVFFSHCTLGCLYCQNHPWSAGGAGDEVGVDGLTAILVEMAEAGCHNWNLVTPGPWLPFIREAAARARRRGAALPFVYNTSGYERVDIAEAYRDLMDVVLTDLRYATPAIAREGSAAPDYPAHARNFLRWAWDHVGPLRLDADGLATGGVIVRILVLPGREAEAVANLEWMAGTIGTDVHLSVMSQYTPVHAAAARDGWNRVVTEAEYARVTEAVERLGFENGWVQEFGACAPDDGLLGCDMLPGAGVAGAGRCAQACL